MADRALIIANRQYLDPYFAEIPSAIDDGGALARVLALLIETDTLQIWTT